MTITLDSFSWSQLGLYHYLDLAGLVFLFMVIIFGLLVFRQAIQMTQVLPTVLSPLVKLLAIVYIIVAIIAFILGLGIVMSRI